MLTRFIPMTLLVAVIPLPAQAATFQYNFNNIEQGPGSHANPTLVIGEKKRPIPVAPAAVTPEEMEPASAPVAVPAGSSAFSGSSAEEVSDASEGYRPWRFSVSASGSQWTKNAKANGVGMHLSYSLLKDVAIGGFAGFQTARSRTMGAEAELTPLRLTTFGWKDWIEAGVMAGGTRWVDGNLPALHFAHAGARLHLNIGGRVGFHLAARTNLTDSTSLKYRQWDGGVHVRF